MTMSAKVNRIIVTSLAVLVVVAVATFAIWISATVGDPRVGNPWSTIITAGFVLLVGGLFCWRMYRDR
jgi:uncharacterized membrane protein YgdD (TMEM256/DUF423 family)